MAATGKTPILLYGSTTASNVPVAGNLTNSSDGCEIAINVADKNLFFKDSTNAVNTVPIRQSSASSNGWLSSTDWNTFNNKQPAGTYVTSVTGTAPVVSSGGTTPAISMAAASGSVNGYLTSTDWTTFNSKAPAFTYTSNYIPYGQGTTTPTQSANLTFNGTSLGVGVSAPSTVGLQLISTNNISWQQSATESIGNIYVQYSSVAPTLANGYKRNTSGTDKFVSSYGANWARSAIAADYGAVYIYADAAATVAVGTAITPTEVAKFDSSGNATIKNGNLVIGTSGKGIDFSVTSQAAGMTSELLADYEEGTFTPAIVGTTTSGTGTYSVQVGRYTKIGNRVMFNLFLTWSAHTGTGNMNISGLPYTSNSTTNNITSLSVWSSGIAFTASNYPQFYLGNNTTTINIAQTIVGTSANNPVTLDTAGSLIVSGQYEV